LGSAVGLFERLRAGLGRTASRLAGRFDDLEQRSDGGRDGNGAVDVGTVEALEELLLSADVGVAATERIVK